MKTQSTAKEAPDRLRQCNQPKAPEVKPKQFELALANLFGILDNLQQDKNKS